MIFSPLSPAGAPPPGPTPPRNDPLMRKAMELEAAFLAEMLGHAGLSGETGDFSGGIGEEQFSSFLRAEQANLLVARGGIGLAEPLFRAMGGGNDGA